MSLEHVIEPYLASIADSFKRIADAAERANPPPKKEKPVPVVLNPLTLPEVI